MTEAQINALSDFEARAYYAALITKLMDETKTVSRDELQDYFYLRERARRQRLQPTTNI
jgi:hypothetical protein